jgi:hypothetical protein
MRSSRTLESWEMPSSDADDDDSEWEETFSRLGIENSASDECSSKPIDIETNGLSQRQRYVSHDQIVLRSNSMRAKGGSEGFRSKEEAEPKPSPSPCLCEERTDVQGQRKRSNSI